RYDEREISGETYVKILAWREHWMNQAWLAAGGGDHNTCNTLEDAQSWSVNAGAMQVLLKGDPGTWEVTYDWKVELRTTGTSGKVSATIENSQQMQVFTGVASPFGLRKVTRSGRNTTLVTLATGESEARIVLYEPTVSHPTCARGDASAEAKITIVAKKRHKPEDPMPTTTLVQVVGPEYGVPGGEIGPPELQ
ncbi:MAG: hypothetical protein JXB62_21880, partial [Pirellulales bacterium]|nr:hypothetical protein [Pirellulales bacterium]